MESLESIIGLTSLSSLGVKPLIMICLSFLLAYLAIVKKYEPLLLLPISFGMLIANISPELLSAEGDKIIAFLYQGIKMEIFPPLIFLCIGALTDFGPLIASPKSALIGIGGQLGIFAALGGALLISALFGGSIPDLAFTLKQAAAIGIIGSSDGPTTIYIANTLAPELFATISIAAYSYMALVPIIQPPIMRLLTTPEERVIVMPKPENVTKRQKIIFPIAMTAGTLLLVPAAGPLISMLMLGNLIRESGVTERISTALQHDLLSLLTLLIALCVGATATADNILTPKTILIILLGLTAFSFGTAGGVLMAKLLNKITGGKVNPLIGNSGVSAMPMAARVSQKVAQEYNPNNYVLMHAMGPIVSSTLGSALVAGIFITLLS
ncbi:MAG: sodium ion-translocating decarboxylase subunit beta [Fibromonadaceae bacterium]|jgi:oxaloacetate decarboxylase beta subunit|nr:sodium ion-translocating decarboxylase subunit beta [Fibromonadaceae bacterium]